MIRDPIVDEVRAIRDAIAEVPDVSEVTLIGGRPRELLVELDPARLAAYGIDPGDRIAEGGDGDQELPVPREVMRVGEPRDHECPAEQAHDGGVRRERDGKVKLPELLLDVNVDHRCAIAKSGG